MGIYVLRIVLQTLLKHIIILEVVLIVDIVRNVIIHK
jgi:hypothetical protein